jgi:hypothetical protein
MTITPTALLSLPIITTGTESGTWGDVVDNGLTSYLDIAIAGGLAISITTTDVTLANTAGTSSVTNIGSTTAQYAILNVSGAMTAARSLILPSSSRQYVINNTCTGGYVLTVKGAATTGITLRNGESAQVAWNGSDFVKVGPGVSIGNTNTAVGTSALLRNTTSLGGGNTALGYEALASATDVNNTAVGYQALYSNTSGFTNTAFGYSAMKLNLSGTNNIGIGANAMFNNSTGGANIAIGGGSLLTATASIQNVVVGFTAMNAGTGSYNTAIGAYALNNASETGNYNTVIGREAGDSISSGAGNVVVGTNTSTGTKAPAFSITTQSNYISMGSTSVTNAYVQVAWTVVSDARDKTDFAPVPHGLDFVSKLQPISYRFKETRDATEGHGPVRYGFKAQDVLALEGDTPVIIDAANPDKLYFNDQALIAVLVNAIKELKAEFDAYKAAHA